MSYLTKMRRRYGKPRRAALCPGKSKLDILRHRFVFHSDQRTIRPELIIEEKVQNLPIPQVSEHPTPEPYWLAKTQ